jgi:hypothetical protein
MNRFASPVALSALLALLGACGGSTLPPAKSAETLASISAATAVGADNNPQGALHLKMARDQLKQAQTLSEDGNGEEAGLVIERAQADAELALVITREAQASNSLRKAQGEVEGLQNKNLP